MDGGAAARYRRDVTRNDTNMLFVRVGEEQAPALGKFYAGAGGID
ncbi:Low-specificity L-threonine aldolase [Klebsiella pneumoniae IS43]|uniref:Low-specificity L-threonine aldolase n=1 Tax=Klebsiella pneumoniae IS43 TaxID=1432552 RepID=W1DQI2_KLEPN|nr:Low-specificity L-threonine aldolase [Klebsiella pneumoniae IS43]